MCTFVLPVLITAVSGGRSKICSLCRSCNCIESKWRPYYRHFHTVINQLCRIIYLDETKGPLNNLDCTLKTYLPVSQVDNFLHRFPLEIMGNSMTEFVNAHDLLDQRTDVGTMYYIYC